MHHTLRPGIPARPSIAPSLPRACPPRSTAGTTPPPAHWLDRVAGWLRPKAPAAAWSVEAARADFDQALADITPSQDAVPLRRRIAVARTMLDLWHLRVPLFHLVAVSVDQPEAERRLRRLNRHFPTRSPRSGFMSLER